MLLDQYPMQYNGPSRIQPIAHTSEPLFISFQDIDLCVFLHRSRALSEQKQILKTDDHRRSTPLPSILPTPCSYDAITTLPSSLIETLPKWRSLYVVPRETFIRFCRNSDAIASEFLQNLEEMCNNYSFTKRLKCDIYYVNPPDDKIPKWLEISFNNPVFKALNKFINFQRVWRHVSCCLSLMRCLWRHVSCCLSLMRCLWRHVSCCLSLMRCLCIPLESGVNNQTMYQCIHCRMYLKE